MGIFRQFPFECRMKVTEANCLDRGHQWYLSVYKYIVIDVHLQSQYVKEQICVFVEKP